MANTTDNKTTKKYSDLTTEEKNKLHSDVINNTAKPKTDRNRKSTEIAKNKEKPTSDTKDLADKATGKTQREIDFDNKHRWAWLTNKKTGKSFKFIYRGVLFSDIDAILITNVSVRSGVLGLANIPYNGGIFHKVDNKTLLSNGGNESVSTFVTDLFLSKTETTTEELAEPLINTKSTNEKLTDYMFLKSDILERITKYNSTDFRIIDANNMTDYEKRLHRIAQSFKDKAIAFSDKLAKALNKETA